MEVFIGQKILLLYKLCMRFFLPLIICKCRARVNIKKNQVRIFKELKIKILVKDAIKYEIIFKSDESALVNKLQKNLEDY